jgi:hypothetical protein
MAFQHPRTHLHLVCFTLVFGTPLPPACKSQHSPPPSPLAEPGRQPPTPINMVKSSTFLSIQPLLPPSARLADVIACGGSPLLHSSCSPRRGNIFRLGIYHSLRRGGTLPHPNNLEFLSPIKFSKSSSYLSRQFFATFSAVSLHPPWSFV